MLRLMRKEGSISKKHLMLIDKFVKTDEKRRDREEDKTETKGNASVSPEEKGIETQE